MKRQREMNSIYFCTVILGAYVNGLFYRSLRLARFHVLRYDNNSLLWRAVYSSSVIYTVYQCNLQERKVTNTQDENDPVHNLQLSKKTSVKHLDTRDQTLKIYVRLTLPRIFPLHTVPQLRIPL